MFVTRAPSRGRIVSLICSIGTQAPDSLDPLDLLENAPDDEFALLELRLDWPYDLDKAHDGDLSRAVGHWAAAAMLAGLTYELVLVSGEYFDRAISGALPRLLDGAGGERGEFGSPSIQVRQPWGPFGLGALQDLVQEAFGSVALDRSKVKLEPVEPHGRDAGAQRPLSVR